jgi:hypothetical protein
MTFNIFKEIKVKCNYCGEIIISKSNKEWTACACEKTKVKGKTSYKRIIGNNYTDLTVVSFDDVPEHRGWNDTREDYYRKKE